MRITMSYDIEEVDLPKFIKDVGKWGRAIEVVNLNRASNSIYNKRENYYRYIEELLLKKGSLTTNEVYRFLSRKINSSYKTISRRLTEMGTMGRLTCEIENVQGLKYNWSLKDRVEEVYE